MRTWKRLNFPILLLLFATACLLLRSNERAESKHPDDSALKESPGVAPETSMAETNALGLFFLEFDSTGSAERASCTIEPTAGLDRNLTAENAIDDETAESICREHLRARFKDSSCELEGIRRTPGRILGLLRETAVSKTGEGLVFRVLLDSETGAIVDDAIEIREKRLHRLPSHATENGAISK